MDTKGGFADLSSKAGLLCWLEHLACAGCCGVIKPDLSATLDNYSITSIILQNDEGSYEIFNKLHFSLSRLRFFEVQVFFQKNL
jgi:hypothetical protein